MSTRIQTLQDDRAAAWQRMQDIWAAAEKEDRALNEAESKEYEELGQKMDRAATEIEQVRAHERRQSSVAEPRRDPALLPTEGIGDEQRTAQTAAYRKAFDRYLRYGMGELDADERRLLRTGIVVDAEIRAQAAQPGSAGGYLIPTEFSTRIIESLKWYGGVRQAVGDGNILSTSTGAPILYPTNDDTGNKGRRIAENATATATDLVFGQKSIGAYLYSSDIVLVPLTLLQDQDVDLEGYVSRKLAERLGRVENQDQTVGTGAAMPQGTVNASTGKTTASATAITYNELIDLEHSVDPAYRRADGAKYMFNDLIFAYLRKLADSQGRPLWVPQFAAGLAGGPPATFNGWNYVINNDMDSTVTSGKTTALFGDFGRGFLVREVQGVTLMRLDERYADALQVAFLAFHRMDSGIVDTGAFKKLVQA